jgi:hypothetical protein
VTRRVRSVATTVQYTLPALQAQGVGTAAAQEPASPSGLGGTGDGLPPGLAATAVALALAALIVGVALGLAVQRRVQPEADRPGPGPVTDRRAAASRATRAAARPGPGGR